MWGSEGGAVCWGGCGGGGGGGGGLPRGGATGGLSVPDS